MVRISRRGSTNCSGFHGSFKAWFGLIASARAVSEPASGGLGKCGAGPLQERSRAKLACTRCRSFVSLSWR
eukprot:12742852-Alexandrium_andersonii.AAC.1